MSLRLTLIGHPVNHSLSPPMHRAAFLSLSCSGTYDLTDVEVERFPTAIEELIHRGMSGWNVTVPHKERMYEFLVAEGLRATLTPEARLVGAVNTVRIDSQGHLHGHNTDMPGFRICVEKNAGTLLPETAVVLGAGGAARACVAALYEIGFKRICVLVRNRDKGIALSNELEQHFADSREGSKAPKIQPIELRQENFPLIGKFQLLVNCTPVGLTSSEPPEGFASLLGQISLENGFFIDTVYRRDRETTFLCELAAASAVRRCDGRSMLVEQAVLAFEFWTGRRPDSCLFESALRSSL
ncbi:MAG: shikimate dehydrogenase [Candidatus Obscuribacterales bacterium]|nr:shikimate dehydrogenase [Candidatus Obscuribacterales bacterium]